MRVKGVISYDGSAYWGFQIQNDQRTIQGELTRVFSQILDMEIHIYGSGRTDKGVHALNQVIHFDVDKEVDLKKLIHGANKLLPDDILVKSLEFVQDNFHSRLSATKKHYRYVLSLKANPFEIKYAWIYPYPVNKEKILMAMNKFVGKHNFVNFCANNEEDNDYEKEIFDFTLLEEKDHLIFDIYGDGFKRYMVRMIIGTVIAYNEDKITLEDIDKHLHLPLGNNVSYKAPGSGLYLYEVFYD